MGGLSTYFMSPKANDGLSPLAETSYGATCTWILVNSPLKGGKLTFAAP